MGRVNKFVRWAGRVTGIMFPKIFGSIFGGLSRYLSLYDVNEEAYTKAFEENDVVNGIITTIAENSAKARWYLRDTRTGKEIKDNVRFNNFKKNCAPQQSLRDVVKSGVTQKLINGNAYYVGEKGRGINKDYLQYFYVIPSENMTIDGSPKGIKSYKPSRNRSIVQDIPANQVMHTRNVRSLASRTTYSDWFKGQSPLKTAMLSVQTYDESRKAGVFFTQNKGAQKAIVLNSGVTLSQNQKNNYKDELSDRGQGISNTANLMLLQEVDKVIDLSADPKKALVLEQRAQAAQEICNVYRFPSQMIGLKNATYQNAKEAKKLLWENCVIPELDEFKDGFNNWSMANFGENIELCYDVSHIDALKEDRPVQNLANIGTVNEARQREGLPPFDDKRGDEIYMFRQGVEGRESNNNSNGENENNQET